MTKEDKNTISTAGLATRTSEEPPIKEFSIHEAERLTAQELTSLSLKAREEVYFDLHGVGDSVDESDPEFVAEKLDQLGLALEKIKNKSAYELAMKRNPHYVKNRAFRLLFLRADMFDPYKAACRLVNHLESKLELFGEELLCQDITQDDLDEGALQFLYSGFCQQLPVRDMSGRLVTIVFADLQDHKISVEQKLRRIFYGAMVSLEDEETQKNGNVFVCIGPTTGAHKADRPFLWKIGRLMSAIPARCGAIHACMSTSQYIMFLPILAMFQFALETFKRLRFRTHVGNLTEARYVLQTFGILACTLPISNEGKILTQHNKEKWEKRRKEERLKKKETVDSQGNTTSAATAKNALPPITRVGTPTKEDVLVGRGRLFQEHLGNIHFRYIIEEHRKLYDKASKQGKTKLTAEIVRQISQRNGRFLKIDGLGWVEVESSYAQTKVSACFRSLRQTKKSGSSKTSEA